MSEYSLHAQCLWLEPLWARKKEVVAVLERVGGALWSRFGWLQKLGQLLWETVWQTLCELNIEVSDDSALPLLIMDPNGLRQTFKDWYMNIHLGKYSKLAQSIQLPSSGWAAQSDSVYPHTR